MTFEEGTSVLIMSRPLLPQATNCGVCCFSTAVSAKASASQMLFFTDGPKKISLLRVGGTDS